MTDTGDTHRDLRGSVSVPVTSLAQQYSTSITLADRDSDDQCLTVRRQRPVRQQYSSMQEL